MNIQNSNRYGKLDPAKLGEFETKLGARLPEDYRAFLLEHNGGKPEKRAFMAPDDPLDEDSELYERELAGFYALHEQNAPVGEATMDAFKLDEAWRDLQNDVPDNTLLPISQDTSGSYICLELSKEKFGSVCFFDHEYEVATTLAESFEAFLNTLTSGQSGN